MEKNCSPILIYQTFLFPATKQNSQNQDSKVMCFPLAKNESDAVIAAWDKWLGGLPSLLEHPSEQLPCCEGGGGRSRLPALAPHCIPRCSPSAWHSGRAQGESVLKVSAMSKGHLRVLGGGRRINFYWTPMVHHAKFWAYKAGLRTVTKCARPSAKWKSVRGQDKGILSDDLMLPVWWGWHEMLWEQRLL